MDFSSVMKKLSKTSSMAKTAAASVEKQIEWFKTVEKSDLKVRLMQILDLMNRYSLEIEEHYKHWGLADFKELFSGLGKPIRNVNGYWYCDSIKYPDEHIAEDILDSIEYGDAGSKPMPEVKLKEFKVPSGDSSKTFYNGFKKIVGIINSGKDSDETIEEVRQVMINEHALHRFISNVDREKVTSYAKKWASEAEMDLLSELLDLYEKGRYQEIITSVEDYIYLSQDR